MNVKDHAYQVVKGFKSTLSKEQKTALNSENYEELQMLVEAALGLTAEVVLHDNAKAVEKLAKKIRKQAKSIDSLEH